MKYRELVKKVANYSGFSDQESETALNLFTETLSSRLEEGERQDFASQLPKELQDVALKPTNIVKQSFDDMCRMFAELQDISMAHAKKQVMATWRALKDAVSPGEINDIRAQLPKDMAAALA